jgi:flagellar hook protein FlgE
MFGAIYTGLSGMAAYSRGLDLISNNVANLNTPGFKVSDPLFREIVYNHLRNSSDPGGTSRPSGAGVSLDTSRLSMRQGDLRDTGNALDASIDGNGFFVLDRDGTQLFTRAGQFEFNSNGVLIERDSRAVVMMRAAAGEMTSFNIDTERSFAPRTTSEVRLTGTLARTGTSTTHEVPGIVIVDSSGKNMSVRLRLTRDPTEATRWHLEVLDAQSVVMGGGDVRFAEDGTPLADNNRVSVELTAEDIEPFAVAFDFGAPGSFAGVTSIAGTTASQVQMLRQDGVLLGSLTRSEFDESGNLKLTYSNGETRTVGSLVLARFESSEQLQSIGRSFYAASDGATPIFGRGMTAGMGKVVGGKIELSNVELTEQFTDLIVIQRGYQASSQVSSVANEMIQQLLAMDGRR